MLKIILLKRIIISIVSGLLGNGQVSNLDSTATNTQPAGAGG